MAISIHDIPAFSIQQRGCPVLGLGWTGLNPVLVENALKERDGEVATILGGVATGGLVAIEGKTDRLGVKGFEEAVAV